MHTGAGLDRCTDTLMVRLNWRCVAAFWGREVSHGVCASACQSNRHHYSNYSAWQPKFILSSESVCLINCGHSKRELVEEVATLADCYQNKGSRTTLSNTHGSSCLCSLRQPRNRYKKRFSESTASKPSMSSFNWRYVCSWCVLRLS